MALAAPSPFAHGWRSRISVNPKKRKGRRKLAGMNTGTPDCDVSIATTRAGRRMGHDAGSPAQLTTMPDSPEQGAAFKPFPPSSCSCRLLLNYQQHLPAPKAGNLGVDFNSSVLPLPPPSANHDSSPWCLEQCSPTPDTIMPSSFLLRSHPSVLWSHSPFKLLPFPFAPKFNSDYLRQRNPSFVSTTWGKKISKHLV